MDRDRCGLAPIHATTPVRENVDSSSERTSTPDGTRDLTISFTADRNELYAAWDALANLADVAGRVSVSVKAASETGLDTARL